MYENIKTNTNKVLTSLKSLMTSNAVMLNDVKYSHAL